MKLRSLVRFLLVLTVVLLASQIQLTARATPAAVFKVGIIAPLTGGLGEYGVAAKNGIELARGEHPADLEGIQFIYEDSQYDGQKALTAFDKLTQVDKVDLVFNWGTEPGRVLAPVAERRKFPLLTLSHEPSIAQGRSYVIRFINAAEDFSKVQADWLRAQGYKRIGIAKAELTYLQSVLEGVKKNLGPDQTLEIIDSFSPSETDFKSSITKIKRQQYDIVGLFLLSGQVSQFARQARDQHLNLPMFGTDFLDSTKEARDAAGALEGAVFSNIAVTDQFRSRYTSRYTDDSQIAYAGNGYDLAVLLGDLFKGTSSPGADEVLKRLKEAGERKGELGTFSFKTGPGQDQHFQFPVVLRRIAGEEIKSFQ